MNDSSSPPVSIVALTTLSAELNSVVGSAKMMRGLLHQLYKGLIVLHSRVLPALRTRLPTANLEKIALAPAQDIKSLPAGDLASTILCYQVMITELILLMERDLEQKEEELTSINRVADTTLEAYSSGVFSTDYDLGEIPGAVLSETINSWMKPEGTLHQQIVDDKERSVMTEPCGFINEQTSDACDDPSPLPASDQRTTTQVAPVVPVKKTRIGRYSTVHKK